MTGNGADARVVGRVVGLWRYPVKSMAPETVTTIDVSWHGMVGDRRWAFVREGVQTSGFPWLTLRQRPDMNRYRPFLVEPEKPDTSPTRVETPSGQTLDVTDPALSRELWPEGARVIRQNRGVFDTFPLSLITTQSVDQLSQLLGSRLDVQRFRPNVLIDAGDGAFPENDWIGRVLRVGGVRMRVDKRDGRCVVITVDPETGERKPQVLRTVVDQRDGCVGVYASTVEPGVLTLEDGVVLEG